MKKILMAVVSIVLLFTSCNSFNNYGYPSKVTFDSWGGEKKVYGEDGLYTLDISDFNGVLANAIRDTIADSLIVTYDWLTAKTRVYDFGYGLTIIAEPNTTGKKRSLYVSGMVDDSFAEIKITQLP